MKMDISARMRPKLGKVAKLPDWSILTIGALVMTFVLEILSQRSVARAARFLAQNPMAFALNWGLVACTFSIALLFHKRLFSLTLTGVLWIAFGIVNYMVLGRRYHAPLSAVDVFIDKEAFLMLPVYYKWWQIALGAFAIVTVLVVLVLAAIKTPKYRRRLERCVLRSILCFLLTAGILLLGLAGGFVADTLKPSLYDAYRDNGFAYCFLYSFFDTRMNKPKGYSAGEIADIGRDMGIEVERATETEGTLLENARDFVSEEVFDNHPADYDADAVSTIRNMLTIGERDVPNIIFIQLESFCDPRVFNNYAIEGDPVPNFRRLMQENTSGKLEVPTVSGATVNTEFEVLTGCNLDFIGSGEFPFYTVLKENVVESLATDLKTLGLTATFLHNYTGSFYGRNTVYSNLCFDRFVSIEYMDGYEKTQKGWVKDNILQRYILDSLETTEERDFVFVVTAQTHGEYPRLTDREPAFAVTKAPGEAEKDSMEYYVTQLAESDAFIGDLIETLSGYPEKTVVVLYGDHLPGISFEVEDLADGDLYATGYVIWANYELPQNDRDIEAYQLGAYTLQQLDLDSGVMVKFHQKFMGGNDYLESMQKLQYDILYGEHIIYDRHRLTRDTVMSFGVVPISVDTAVVRGENLFVTGSGFNADSRIFVDGDEVDTIFVDTGLLIAQGAHPDTREKVEVRQVAADGSALSAVSAPGWGVPEAKPDEDSQTETQESETETQEPDAETLEPDAETQEPDAETDQPPEAGESETTDEEPSEEIEPDPETDKPGDENAHNA